MQWRIAGQDGNLADATKVTLRHAHYSSARATLVNRASGRPPLEVLPDTGTEGGKLKFTKRGRQIRGVETHIKVPFATGWPMNNLKVNLERRSYCLQDVQKRVTVAGSDVIGPAHPACDETLDDPAQVGRKNVISQDLAVAVEVSLSLLADTGDKPPDYAPVVARAAKNSRDSQDAGGKPGAEFVPDDPFAGRLR